MLKLIGAVSMIGLATAAAAEAPAPTSPPPAAAADAAVNASINAPLPPEEAAMKSHVMFLAADAMKGREASSPEYAIAAQYVASQFYEAGLRPAGDNGGFLQAVPLVAFKAADKGSAAIERKGQKTELAFGVDYVPVANPAAKATSVSAPVVFVGQGIVAPQYGRDDYAGVDVRGKIVALFAGAPQSFAGEERAHFSSIATKAAIARAHGAIGVVTLESGGSGRGVQPFARSAQGWDRPRTTWATPDGLGASATPGTPVLATISVAGAAKLFDGARTPWKTIAKFSADSEARYRSMALPATLTITSSTSFEPSASSNVVGMIPGSDPVVGREVVVLSAHLDHIGVRRTGTGDLINNGAEDNAVGIASLIEEAKRFKASGKAPRRTVMFLAVTAEEKGLVGSDYFANNPTVPKTDIVADVNLDMPILTYPFQDVIVFGADRSTLGPIVRRAVADIGVTVSPDPIPDEGIFVRSDHYRFVQQGVPAVFLWPGQGGPGKAAVDDFLKNHYHQPSDEITLPIDWAQGVRFVDVNYRIAREIADGASRPVWNKGDFFGQLYNGPGAH